MQMKCIKYKSGYKYQLKNDYDLIIPIYPESDIKTDYILLNKEGLLVIKTGYAWDGPSGPTIDTKNFMRGSLVHDALYQLMREEHLSSSEHRDKSDRLLQEHCKQDGMSSLRAWMVYKALKLGGGPAADPANDKPIKYAPKNCHQDI